MRKETFSKRKIGKQLVSVTMLSLLLAPVALSTVQAVSAEEKAAQATADISSQLTAAIEKAKSLGVKVEVEGTKTFQSTAEANAFKQEQLKKLQSAITEAEKNSEANKKAKEDYEKAKAEYDKKKTEYDKQKAEYDKQKAKYDQEKAKYDKALAEARANTDKDGWLTEVSSQSMNFKNEPHARIDSITGAAKFIKSSKIASFGSDSFAPFDVDRYRNFDFSNQNESNYFILNQGDSAEVTYSNLSESSYKGRKITKAKFKYTLLNSDKRSTVVRVFDDPTQTVQFGSGYRFRGRGENLKIEMTLYYEDGTPVEYDKDNPALFGNFSMNRLNDYYESVSGLTPNEKFIRFAGSPVRDHDGIAYADISIDSTPGYSDHESNNRYHGGIVVQVNSGATYTVVVGSSTGAAGHWHAVSTNLYSPVVTKPAPPTTPEPIKPTPPALTNVTTAPSEPVKITDAVVVNTTHVEVGTNKELAPKEEGTKPKKSIDGYEFVETKTKDGNTIHYYTPKKPEEPKKPDPKPEVKKVITKHIDITNGKELHPQEEGTKPKRSFDGYEFVETKTEDGNTIHFYKPVDKTPIKPKEDKKVYTRHYDITTGKELTKREDGTQPKRTFDGYEFVETKTKDGDTEHYYKPVAKPITRHIDKDTGKELTPPEEGNKPKKDIPGYKYVETKDKDGNTEHYYQKVRTRHYDVTTGKEISPQEDGTQPKKDIPGYEFVETKDKDGDTEHFYRPVKPEVKKVVTKHIDKKTGKELVPQEDGTQPKKDIPGYRFVETKDEDGNTIHYYEQVITKHINIENGEEIAPQEDGTQPKKDIEGFEFVETKDENGDTHHFYRPIKKVYTKHIDKETGKELAPQEDDKQPKRTFDGYEFVETKDENGNTIHYYQKVKPAAPVKGKTPAKYAETNESSGMLATLAGLSLASVLAFFVKKRKSN